MKKVQQVFLGLVVLLAFGCGKDDDGGAPEPVYTSCRLIKSVDHSNGYMNEFNYDGAGRLSKTTSTYGYDFLFEYNSLGKLSARFQLVGSDTVVKYLYEYNSDSLVSKHTDYSQDRVTKKFNPVSFTLYTYNSQKLLATATRYQYNNPGVIDFKMNCFYPATNKMRLEVYYKNSQTNALELNNISETIYDNNKPPMPAEPGHINHNQVKTVTQMFSNGSVSSTDSSNTVYTFNTAGYPLTATYNNSNTTTPSTFSYTYTCQ